MGTQEMFPAGPRDARHRGCDETRPKAGFCCPKTARSFSLRHWTANTRGDLFTNHGFVPEAAVSERAMERWVPDEDTPLPVEEPVAVLDEDEIDEELHASREQSCFLGCNSSLSRVCSRRRRCGSNEHVRSPALDPWQASADRSQVVNIGNVSGSAGLLECATRSGWVQAGFRKQFSISVAHGGTTLERDDH